MYNMLNYPTMILALNEVEELGWCTTIQ